MAVSRIAGAALLGLAVSCWPGPAREASPWALRGMLTYSFLAAAVLVYREAVAHVAGRLLWPAVGAHIAIAGSLLLASRRTRW
ncbi:MAG TPA: hypothetical protein VMT17_06065 [Anaeromyxobacteraceae bacterium]|nr:hypothetical protein [Anaeromyxobacteraceae bacterium]